MKHFIVAAVLIASVAGNSVNRAAGWGANNGGWGSNNSGWGGSIPTINIGLDAAVAAVGAGTANANQQLAEYASGNGWNPAVLASNSGILASVDQSDTIEQVAIANAAQGTSSTINEGTVQQSALGLDTLEAYAAGANYAEVQNSAATNADGHGELGAALDTHNIVNYPGGWKQS